MRNRFKNVELTIHILEFQEEYYNSKVKAFEDLTGAKVNRVLSTQASWFSDLEEDMSGGGLIDLYSCFGIWIPTFAEKGTLLDLTEYVQKQPGLDWFDVLPAVRKGVASYKGRIYNIPVDGDVILMLYRRDLVEDVGLPTPKSWDDVLEITKYYENRDINGDGIPDFANCFSSKPEDIGDKIFWAFASSFLQTLGSEQGAFFDPETFEPKSNHPKFMEILEIYNKLVQSSPFRENGPTGWQETLAAFESGRCILWYNYPGPTRILVSNQEKNNMTGVLNYAVMPGMACDDQVQCPYAENGINHAPLLASGGLGFAVSNRSPPSVQEAAISFAFYLIDPEVCFWDVAYPGSFLDPYRQRLTVALRNPNSPQSQAFLDFGWEERQLDMIKDVTEFNFFSENYVQDLRILGVVEYQDTSTIPHLVKMWDREATASETAKLVTDSWNQITEKYGLRAQRDMYRKTLGLQPYIEPDKNYTTIIIVVSITFSLLMFTLGCVLWKLQQTITYKTRETINAPLKGDVAIIFTDVEGSTTLWDSSKQIMSRAIDIHHGVIREVIQLEGAYEIKTIEDSFMIAVGSADTAVTMANKIQQKLLDVSWPVELASLPSSCVEYFPVSRGANNAKDFNPADYIRRKMFSGLRVRIGVHIGNIDDGEVQVDYDQITKGFDYHGQAANVAARIEAMALGGQTLISHQVYEKMSQDVRENCHMMKVGEVELREVSKAVHLFQCLPLALKGRRFYGVLRRESSAGQNIASFNGNILDSAEFEEFDQTVDVMTLTPIQLQGTVLRLQSTVARIKEEYNDLLQQKLSDDELRVRSVSLNKKQLNSLSA